MNAVLINIYKKFECKWIALNEKRNKVLASGSSIKEVEDVLKKKKLSAYEIKYILPLNKFYAPIYL